MKKILSKLKKINDFIALKATLMIGTMWCVYAFMILTLIPLVFPTTNTAIQYVSSAFLQLVFLPLIMVGQDVLGKKAERRSAKDHEVITQLHKDIKDLHVKIDTIKNVMK